MCFDIKAKKMTTEKLIVVHEGNKFYFSNKKLHNEDGPAVILKDGTYEYWNNGKRHNIDGPAIYNNNTKLYIYIKNGKVNPVIYTWSANNNGKKRVILDPQVITDAITRTKSLLEEIEDIETFHIEATNKKSNFYYKGMLHRCCCSTISGYGPAETTEMGSKFYYMYGVKHREDGPAVYDNVTKQTMWYYMGMIHRDDGPANIYYSDEKVICHNMWYKYGVLNNDKDPAYIMFNVLTRDINSIYYYKDGLLHREDGPSMVIKMRGGEYKWWHQDGEFHNLNGPAYDGEIKRWAINGVMHTEEEYNKTIKNVRKFLYKLRGFYRMKASKELYKNTNLCIDVTEMISEYLF